MKDIKQAVTNNIIASLEEGGVEPWVCPWINTGENPMPYNFSTGSAYNGINILLLWLSAMNKGFTRNGWLTFNQARALGGHIRKGEQGTRGIIYKMIDIQDSDNTSEKSSTKRAYCNSFVLFNLDQIDGLEIPELVVPEMSGNEIAVEKFNNIANEYAERTGLTVQFGGDKACYFSSFDLVRMPTTFTDGGDYVATYSHEIGHSTGHKKRLARYENNGEKFDSMKDEYAHEELVAEIFASFISASLGVSGQNKQHVSYISCWLKHLKNDKNFIFRAAGAASKAFDLVMNSTNKESQKKAA